jgi:hypothetical protein
MPPPGLGSSIGPISLHNAIGNLSHSHLPKPKPLALRYRLRSPRHGQSRRDGSPRLTFTIGYGTVIHSSTYYGAVVETPMEYIPGYVGAVDAY